MEDDTPRGTERSARSLAGSVIAGRYRIADVVSSGANTIITDAVDLEADRPVTLKIVQPELARSASFRRAFRRQADLAMVMTHPNIAVVLDWGEIGEDGIDSVFWVVEYLGGGSLRDLFDRGRLLQPSQALVVGLEACRALDAAHRRGIVHTEITPSKLVFGEDARLRVVDFGMAELLGVRAWADPATVPTHVARYASPEQALGLEVDAKTDVYALSLCLIESVTGKVPFAGDSTVSTLAARVGKLMPVSADMGSLASVLERAGRPEAEDRFTAAEFGRALVQAAEKLPRPDPVPILAASLFAMSQAQLRRPSDPTGGLLRPDEEGDTAADEDEAGDAPTGVAATSEVADAPATEPDPSAAGPVVAVAAVGIAAGLEPDLPATEPVDAMPATDPAPTDPAPTDPAPADPAPTAPAPTAPAPSESVDVVSDGGEDLPATEPVQAVPESDAAPAGLAPTEPVDAVPGVRADPSETAPTETAPMETATAAAPLVILTDVADNPTGAVEAGGGAPPPGSTRTAVMPTTVPPPVDATPSGTLYDAEQESRPWGKYLLITLVALVGVGLLGAAGWYLLRTESFEVPDLVGVDEAVARNEIAGNGWDVVTERERSDEVPEIDHVVRTAPVAGVMLDEGETFVLVVSDGPELRTLPELEGLAVADAEATLVDLRLVPVRASVEYSETVPAGSVISWVVQDDTSLTAGAQVLPDTVIELTVSQGPEPRPAPTLAGLPVDEATAAVEALQLEFARGEDVFSNDVAEGLVVNQVPLPGTLVERGGTVTVQVSKGPDLVPIPDLEGLSFPEARTALTDAGFVIDSLLGTTEGTFVSISVDGEEVAAGDTFLRGTGVDLVFL